MASNSKAEHYTTGMVLILVGAFGVIGSITGNLAPMLAALWVPDALITSSGGKKAESVPIVGAVLATGATAINQGLKAPGALTDSGYEVLQWAKDHL